MAMTFVLWRKCVTPFGHEGGSLKQSWMVVVSLMKIEWGREHDISSRHVQGRGSIVGLGSGVGGNSKDKEDKERGEFSLTDCPVAESPNHKRKKVVAFVFDFFFVVVGGSSNVF